MAGFLAERRWPRARVRHRGCAAEDLIDWDCYGREPSDLSLSGQYSAARQRPTATVPGRARAMLPLSVSGFRLPAWFVAIETLGPPRRLGPPTAGLVRGLPRAALSRIGSLALALAAGSRRIGERRISLILGNSQRATSF
jgi:hypothetical protein